MFDIHFYMKVHDLKYRVMNGEKIEPSKTTDIDDAVIGVDMNTFRIKEHSAKLQKLFRAGKHFRHFGANAQEICYVADGSTEAFIDMRGKLRVTDMVASYLILKEAGGIIRAPEGNELDAPLEATARLSFISAANNTLYEKIRELTS